MTKIYIGVLHCCVIVRPTYVSEHVFVIVLCVSTKAAREECVYGWSSLSISGTLGLISTNIDMKTVLRRRICNSSVPTSRTCEVGAQLALTSKQLTPICFVPFQSSIYRMLTLCVFLSAILFVALSLIVYSFF